MLKVVDEENECVGRDGLKDRAVGVVPECLIPARAGQGKSIPRRLGKVRLGHKRAPL